MTYEMVLLAGAIAIVMFVGAAAGLGLGYTLDAWDAWRHRRG
jgi:hypothetical protein